MSSRRTDPNDAVHVDLKHIDRYVFDFVLRHIYADTEEQLFDEVRSESLEDFIDLVFEVAFTANELMVDKLAQVCQKMLGRFGEYIRLEYVNENGVLMWLKYTIATSAIFSTSSHLATSRSSRMLHWSTSA